MDYKKITLKYYSQWLGIEVPFMERYGVFFIKSIERDKKQIGYPDVYDLYAFIQKDNIIISYETKADNFISVLQKQVDTSLSVNNMSILLTEIFKKSLHHNIKYVFSHSLANILSTVKLTKNDYRLYLDFFKAVHPSCSNIDWLQEYFDEICEKEFCHAVMSDDKCVSVTDAPSMPYMNNTVQEIGINTLPGYMGKGYAKAACISCIESMLSKNICPQWSTTIDNVASQKLALSVGFDKLADVLTITL